MGFLPNASVRRAWLRLNAAAPPLDDGRGIGKLIAPVDLTHPRESPVLYARNHVQRGRSPQARDEAVARYRTGRRRGGRCSAHRRGGESRVASPSDRSEIAYRQTPSLPRRTTLSCYGSVQGGHGFACHIVDVDGRSVCPSPTGMLRRRRSEQRRSRMAAAMISSSKIAPRNAKTAVDCEPIEGRRPSDDLEDARAGDG